MMKKLGIISALVLNISMYATQTIIFTPELTQQAKKFIQSHAQIALDNGINTNSGYLKILLTLIEKLSTTPIDTLLQEIGIDDLYHELAQNPDYQKALEKAHEEKNTLTNHQCIYVMGHRLADILEPRTGFQCQRHNNDQTNMVEMFCNNSNLSTDDNNQKLISAGILLQLWFFETQLPKV